MSENQNSKCIMRSCFPLTFILLTLITIKAISKLITGWDRSATCLVGKTTLVTGANSGIGFYTCQDFAKRGARVILACRNKEKGEHAKNVIIENTGNNEIQLKLLDLSSLRSIREFAQEIISTEQRLDILVNNAGVAGYDDVMTSDGLNMVMQVNHLGPFLLTNLLLDLLKKSAPSRIINVTCNAAHMAQLDPNNINLFPTENRLPKAINYANSKLCTILYTNELARRLQGSNVSVNSLNPGIADTNIYRRINSCVKCALQCLAYVMFKNCEEGAQTSIYVATSKDIEGISGQYFDNCGLAWLPPMPPAARDENLACKVWDKSEELVCLTSTERAACRCRNTRPPTNQGEAAFAARNSILSRS